MRDSIKAARLNGARDEANAAVFEFRFDASDPTFAGHFPGRPMLPGVYQLEMARAGAERILECALSILEIPRAKFVRPIVPGEMVRLELKLTDRDGMIQTRASFFVGSQPAGEVLMSLRRHS